MVNCYLCSSLTRKEEKEAEFGSRGELVKKYIAEGRVQGCKQTRGIGADKSRVRHQPTIFNRWPIQLVNSSSNPIQFGLPDGWRPSNQQQIWVDELANRSNL